jgi:hypothetical protein
VESLASFPIPSLRLQLGGSQAKRICNDRDRTEAHGGTGDDWTEEDAKGRVQRSRRNGHAQDVVDKGEEKVLPDIAHDRPAEPKRFYDAAQVTFDEDDPSAFDGNVGAGAHSDANVGGCECGGVVDAVASHRDNLARFAKTPDFIMLVPGIDFGADIVDIQFTRDGKGCVSVVTGEHDDFEAELMQFINRIGRTFLDGIGDSKNASSPGVNGGEDDRVAVGLQLFGFTL